MCSTGVYSEFCIDARKVQWFECGPHIWVRQNWSNGKQFGEYNPFPP